MDGRGMYEYGSIFPTHSVSLTCTHTQYARTHESADLYTVECKYNTLSMDGNELYTGNQSVWQQQGQIISAFGYYRGC